MKKSVFMLFLTLGVISAQEKKPDQEKSLKASTNITWEANQEIEKRQFVTAEAKFRQAISKNGDNIAAPYNLGNAYYNNERYTEAFGRFKQAGETAKDKDNKHNAYHNMGNVFMKNKEYEKAVEAYKEALRSDPSDDETRYNLALAKEMLKKEQNDQDQKDKDNQDQKDQKEQNQDKENEGDNQDKNKQEQNKDQNKDQGDEGEKGDKDKEDNKEGEGDEKEEQQKQPQPGEDGEQDHQPKPNQLSPQQIQNLLEAMQNEERKVQEKLDAQKVKGIPSKSKKDW